MQRSLFNIAMNRLFDVAVLLVFAGWSGFCYVNNTSIAWAILYFVGCGVLIVIAAHIHCEYFDEEYREMRRRQATIDDYHG